MSSSISSVQAADICNFLADIRSIVNRSSAMVTLWAMRQKWRAIALDSRLAQLEHYRSISAMQGALAEIETDIG